MWRIAKLFIALLIPGIVFSQAQPGGNAYVPSSGGSSGSLPTIVQSAFARQTSNFASQTLTLSSSPTVGNYLVVVGVGYGISNAGVSYKFDNITWAELYAGANNSQALGVWTRKVQVGDGTTWANFGTDNGSGTWGIYEISNLIDVTVSANVGFPTASTVVSGQVDRGYRTNYTICALERDTAGAESSLTGCTLVYDGTSAGASGHPAVLGYVGTGALTAVTWTLGASATTNGLMAAIHLYGP